MFMRFSILVITTLLVLVTTACAQDVTPTPDGGAPPPTTPAVISPTITIESPTPQAGGALPTPQATEAVPTIMPGEGTLTPLAPLPMDTIQIKAPYGEQWFPYLVARRAESPMGPAPIPSTLNILDAVTGASWEVTRDCDDFICEYAWLSDGHLLWLEEGNVFIAEADGANKRDLNAPEGMTEIFGVSPNDVAVLRGGEGSSLWRLYLPEGTFDTVPDAVPNTGGVPDFTAQNDLLYFTADGSLAGLSYSMRLHAPGSGTTLIALPLEAGTAPTLLAAPTGFEYPGRGGPPPLPPVPLPGTGYWMPTETLWMIQGEARVPLPVLIDGQTGEFRELETLMGLNNNGYSILYTQLSPDRKWLAAYVQNAPRNEPPPDNIQRVYVAPVTDLDAGTLLTGTIEAWQAHPAAIILKTYGQSGNSLAWVSLVDGSTTTLFSEIDLFAFGTNLSSEQAIFVQPNRFLGTVGVVAPDGTLAGTQELPLYTIRYDEVNNEQRVDPVYAEGVNAYFIAGDPAATESEQAYLWKWSAVE